MDDSFNIDIIHNGTEAVFEAKLVTQGYLHKIIVIVSGREIAFEPDEERKYRAIVPDDYVNKINEYDKSLIQAINERLDSINF